MGSGMGGTGKLAFGRVPDSLTDFTVTTFSHGGKARDVYRLGEGPAVIVIAEIPGITPKVADFARRVVDIGCTAVLPVLFGEPGADPSVVYALRSIGPACVSKEFAAFAANRTAPITVWLRALAADAHESCGGPGVGAVGMCFTGGFALGHDARRPHARAGAQPAVAARRVDEEGAGAGCSCPTTTSPGSRSGPPRASACSACASPTTRPYQPERFEQLRQELGDNFIGVEIDSSKGNPWGFPSTAHSVLTEHLVDEPGNPTHDALNQVLEFFRDRLLSAG